MDVAGFTQHIHDKFLNNIKIKNKSTHKACTSEQKELCELLPVMKALDVSPVPEHSKIWLIEPYGPILLVCSNPESLREGRGRKRASRARWSHPGVWSGAEHLPATSGRRLLGASWTRCQF